MTILTEDEPWKEVLLLPRTFRLSKAASRLEYSTSPTSEPQFGLARIREHHEEKKASHRFHLFGHPQVQQG